MALKRFTDNSEMNEKITDIVVPLVKFFLKRSAFCRQFVHVNFEYPTLPRLHPCIFQCSFSYKLKYINCYVCVCVYNYIQNYNGRFSSKYKTIK